MDKKKYLVKFKPLEPYFFGGENTFRIGEKSKYYISSLLFPPQSTIIGTLRYEILKQNGSLQQNRRYTIHEKKQCDELIGANSYTVGADNKMGKILDISPMFLTDSKNEIYIHTPLNCKTYINDNKYAAMELDREVETSHKKIHLPKQGEYNSKDSVPSCSFMRLSDLSIFNKLFTENENIGISKGMIKEAFFKKKLYSLDKDFSFAVVVELDNTIKLCNSVCYMGRGKSAFKLIVEETNLNIEEEIKTALSAEAINGFHYVFGDTFVEKTFNYTDFAVIRTDTIRMLTTTSENNQLKISCIENFHQIIKAGSVLYANDIKTSAKYGFNNILQISGGKKQ